MWIQLLVAGPNVRASSLPSLRRGPPRTRKGVLSPQLLVRMRRHVAPRQIKPAVSFSTHGKLGAGGYAIAFEEASQMRLDSLGGDPEIGSDFVIGPAIYDAAHDRRLAFCQRLPTRCVPFQKLSRRERWSARHHPANGRDDLSRLCRLKKVAARAEAHRDFEIFRLREARENDERGSARVCDAAQQLGPRAIREAEIDQHHV